MGEGLVGIVYLCALCANTLCWRVARVEERLFRLD
jgi:hypothetical protein